jgi:hypothetical protein
MCSTWCVRFSARLVKINQCTYHLCLLLLKLHAKLYQPPPCLGGPGANNRILPGIFNRRHYFNIYLLFTHIGNVHWCCSLSIDVCESWRTEKEHAVSAAWSWRQHYGSDRRAAVFIISFVSTVLLSLRHVADIVSWLLHVLTHAGMRPTLASQE